MLLSRSPHWTWLIKLSRSHWSLLNSLNLVLDATLIASMQEVWLLSLGRDKSDDDGLSSNHLLLATSVLTGPLANLFTAALRRGYNYAYFAK